MTMRTANVFARLRSDCIASKCGEPSMKFAPCRSGLNAHRNRWRTARKRLASKQDVDPEQVYHGLLRKAGRVDSGENAFEEITVQENGSEKETMTFRNELPFPTPLLEIPMNRLTKSLVLCLAAGFSVAVIAPNAPAEPKSASAKAAAKTSVVEPLSERYARADTDEVPDFQRHVVPLLGRLGCNGRACHGSFQGRGGFQLSLFGYDFKADHEAMLDEDTGRVDLDDIDESLILAKPIDADVHEGGKRFDQGSWQHHVLRRWVESGAKFDGKMQTLKRLEVVPAEILFKQENQHVQLKAFAHWEGGGVEDVTELCRFSSNDDAIAAIDERGRVQSGERGDTHVVVYYDNAVIPVPVMRPVASMSEQPTKLAKPIDQLVQDKLNKLGIAASGPCTDSEFIRRVSLDVTGILPSAERVRSFLADASPDKRQRLIDELLDSPGYSAWWATRFSDWTGNSEEQLNNVLPIRGAATRIWHEWLRARLDKNVPYDDIIEGIVSAQSRNEGESYLEYCKSMTEACKPGNENMYAERDGLPLYWSRRNFAKPEDRAIGFAYAFLGVRIECAQCHKHPFDQWSKNDFEEFSKLFGVMRYNQNQVAADAKEARTKLIEKITEGKKLNNGDLRRAITVASRNGEIVPFGELLVNTRAISDRVKKARAQAKKKGRKLPPLNIPEGTILGQDEAVKLDKDPRPALMDWLRSEDNPYFAKAIVNRIWSNYFGIGIVDPTDDMNLANPPSNAPLLDHLAKEFIAHNYDLKWLHREICNSDTYQRSADTNESNKMDRINFSHHVPRRLPAEVIYDSVNLATGSDSKTSEMRDEINSMAIAEGKPRQRNQVEFALEVFGQSSRESNCDCDRSDSPSLLQSIYLRNDAEIHQKLSDKDGWVSQACQALGVPGPKAAVKDARALQRERAALGLKRQFAGRIRQFNNLPEIRREKMRPQLVKEHARLVKKFSAYGFAVPPLKELLADTRAWMSADLEPVNDADEVQASSVDQIVDDAYLRTLSRYPDDEEKQIAVAFITESERASDGVQSLLWALVNTKEFIITH